MLGYPSATVPQPNDSTGDLSDAYEAAQHILKALNFSGELLKMPEERTLEAGPSGNGLDADMTVESVRAQLQAQLALLAAQLSEIASEPDGMVDTTVVVPSIPVQSAMPDNNTTAPVSSLDAVAAILAGMLTPDGSASSTATATPASAVSPTPQVVYAPPPVPPPVSTHPMELISVKQEEQVIHLHPPAPPPLQEMAPPVNDAYDSDDEEMDEVVV